MAVVLLQIIATAVNVSLRLLLVAIDDQYLMVRVSFIARLVLINHCCVV